MYLHYDTETTGLNKEGFPSDDPEQPAMLSLSAVLDDPDGKTIDTFNTLIRPLRPVEAEAFGIHGISYDRAMADGIGHVDAMRRFREMAERAEVLSAFNHFYDFKMMKIGCARMPDGEQLRVMLEGKSAICTMNAAHKHLGAGRFIKLKVAHEQLLGVPFTKGHDSQEDVQAHRRIFYHLREVGALLEPTPLTRKTYSTPPPKRPNADEAPAPLPSTETMLNDAIAQVRKRPAALE